MRRLLYYILVILLLNACTLPDVDFGTPTATTSPTVTNTATVTATPSITPTATPTIDPTPTREEGFRPSFNMNGEELDNVQRQFYQDFFLLTQPTSLTIMNNPAWACQLSELLPDTYVIDRKFSPAEGDEWREFTGDIGTVAKGPDDWVSDHLNRPCNTTLIHSINEPGLGNIEDFVAWEIEVMRLLHERNTRGVFGNFSAGSVPPTAIEDGLFDDWYVALDEGNHFAGTHNYSTAFAPWGFGRMPRSFLLDKASMQPENWTANFPVARIALPAMAQMDDELGFGLSEYFRLYGDTYIAEAETLILPPNWHLRRDDWHIIRAIEQDLPPPRFILTEAFWDNMPDIDEGSNGFNPIAQLRNRYGIERYTFDMRGVNSYQRLYADYFPFWDMPEAIFCQIVYLDYMYPREYYVGFNMFTISNNSHWISFNMDQREAGYYDKFYDLMEAYATEGDTTVCGDYFWNR